MQCKCFSEIREVLGDDRQKAVSLTLLNNLNYLELVIKESLRLFPSVAFVARKLREEIQLGKHLFRFQSVSFLTCTHNIYIYSEGKYTLPKGTDVTIPILFMGHDPKLFPDPETFRPERFLAENIVSETNPYAYIPFSAGPRNCNFIARLLRFATQLIAFNFRYWTEICCFRN